MSRIGKKSITIPEGVSIDLNQTNRVIANGPKGTLETLIMHPISIEVKEQEMYVFPKEQIKNINAFWGLYRSLLSNMIMGVSQGFTKVLRIEGVGYRVSLQGNKLVMNLGYSHPVEFEAPQGITFAVEKNLITVTGIDKQLVGKVSSDIRSKRPPEPYKGKGVRYNDEIVRIKQGKKSTS